MRIRTALLCFVVSACGGNDEESEAAFGGTCNLRADVRGATALEFTGKDDAACLTQHSFDTGLDVTFSGLGGKGMFEVTIDDVPEGETGDYPAQIVVTSAAKERWQGMDCTVSITAHDLVEVEQSEIGEMRHYQVDGQGGCAGPLESVPAGSDPVSVRSFSFRTQITWRD